MSFLDPEFRFEANRAISEMAKRLSAMESKLRDKLTEKQFEQLLWQVMASGDFVRLVRCDGAQAMEYIPFRDKQMLEDRIKELECQVKALQRQIRCCDTFNQ